MLVKVILDAIEQLEIYTTNKVQEWKEIMQRPSNSEEQDRVATAVWETYRDMANKIADLGELAEKQNLLNLNNVKKAFAIANNAIYFNDNSDFLTALYQVCKTLNPEIEDELIGSKYIEED